MECPKCSHITNLESEINFRYFICPKCYSLFQFHEEQLHFKNTIPKTNSESFLNLGKSVTLENETFCVANFIIKCANGNEYWTEYELISLSGKRKYVIEENGNWIISKQIEVKRDSYSLEIHHNDIDYKIFEKGFSTDVSGAGFFEYKFSKETIGFRDYINPPYILSVEVEDNKSTYYLGTHHSGKEIKKIFNIEILPSKDTIGIVQPFYVNLNNLITIFCIASILVLCIHLFYYQTAKNQLIYSNDIDLNSQIDKEIETDVFELEGPIAPLNIFISSNVDNSWLATDFSLVNQTTNESVYFSKDVELYSGYEGGESWTEGSNYEDFTICGVSAGRYKIAFKSNKDTDDIKNSTMHLEVYWDKNNNWNFMIVLMTFVVITIFLYYLKNNFESRRWNDSDYSTYNDD